MKKLPYEIVWVDFPDIKAKAKAVGAPPTRVNADGSEGYTVPFVVIEAPKSPTPIVLSDSTTIVKYLDETFPDPNVPLFPTETRVLDSIFDHYLSEKVVGPAIRFVFPAIANTLPPHCLQRFKDSRKAAFGVPFEVLAPSDSESRSALRKGLEEAFDGLALLLDAGGKGNHRLNDGKVTFAEIKLAAYLWLIRATDKDEDGAWAILKERNDGRWARVLEVPEYKVLTTL